MALTIPGLSLLNAVTGKELRPDVLLRGSVLFVFAGLLLGSGLLAGIYPAVYLSAFRPVKVLKGKMSDPGALLNIRKFLVVGQFMIATGLIFSTIGPAKKRSTNINVDE